MQSEVLIDGLPLFLTAPSYVTGHSHVTFQPDQNACNSSDGSAVPHSGVFVSYLTSFLGSSLFHPSLCGEFVFVLQKPFPWVTSFAEPTLACPRINDVLL
jgi:hypothetical protein